MPVTGFTRSSGLPHRPMVSGPWWLWEEEATRRVGSKPSAARASAAEPMRGEPRPTRSMATKARYSPSWARVRART